MRKDVSREQSLEVIAKFAQNFPFSNLSSDDAQKFIKDPKKFCTLFAQNLTGKKYEVFPQETSHLRLIGETTISATKAGPGMKQENQTLFCSVDPDFDNWDAQTVSKDAEEAKAFVYEQMQNGTYAQIFGSFNKNLDLLEFETHEQIKDFVKNSPELLHPKGYSTHFIFRNKKGERFVANVFRDSDGGLDVSVFRFSYDFVWDAEYAYRFVFLATKTLEPKS
jgi:hypothetical protein